MFFSHQRCESRQEQQQPLLKQASWPLQQTVQTTNLTCMERFSWLVSESKSIAFFMQKLMQSSNDNENDDQH